MRVGQELQKKKIAEYKQKKRQTEELLANADFVDIEDFSDDAELGGSDELEGFVDELRNVRKRAPPAVV